MTFVNNGRRAAWGEVLQSFNEILFWSSAYPVGDPTASRMTVKYWAEFQSRLGSRV